VKKSQHYAQAVPNLQNCPLIAPWKRKPGLSKSWVIIKKGTAVGINKMKSIHPSEILGILVAAWQASQFFGEGF
jgi:hypothetical protein